MSDLLGAGLGESSVRRCASWTVLLGLLLGQASLQAQDALFWGVQAGLVVPAAPDLKLTAGSGLAPTLGGRVEWGSREDLMLRLRLDVTRFRGGNQVADSQGFHQEISTKVRNESLALEQLFYQDRWSLGVGLCAVHWTVDSTNRLVTATDTFAPTGSSSTTRVGLSLVGGYRWTRHADLELRFVSSHYGQENQPAGMVSLNFVWTF